MLLSRKMLGIIVLLALMVFIGVDYHNEINKVDERVIRGIAEYTLVIENTRTSNQVYELKDKLKIEEDLGELIPVNEKSKRDVEYILLMKDLNELLYRSNYSWINGKEQEALEAEETYKEFLDRIQVILLPYRDKYSEVDELWSQGAFTD